MRFQLFEGEINQVDAEAVCSSSNPHLELMAGTGGALREAGGLTIQAECQAHIEAERRRTGRRYLSPGSVRWTNAGTLPYRGLMHAVAIDSFHHCDAETVAACMQGVLKIGAEKCIRSLAFPIFGTGNGDMDFAEGLNEVLRVCRAWPESMPVELIIVVRRPEDAAIVRRMVDLSTSP